MRYTVLFVLGGAIVGSLLASQLALQGMPFLSYVIKGGIVVASSAGALALARVLRII